MAGTARVRGLTAISALALASLAGCGGDPEPTAEEVKAAKSRWVQRVDAACRKANDAIADRGWPVNLVDLDRLVVRGIDDAQAAIKSISGQKVPEGAGPQPGAFVKELKALEPELTSSPRPARTSSRPSWSRPPRRSSRAWPRSRSRAEEAGLSDCMSHDERFFVPDAVRAPVFAEQLARLDKRLLRRIKDVDFAAADSLGELAVAFRDYSEVVDSAVDGIDRLDPPQWAADQVGNYQVALRDLQSVSQKYTAMLVADKDKPLDRWTPPSTCGWRSSSSGTARAEAKTRRKMLRAVGAGPTMVPNEEAPESDSEQQS